MMDPWKAPGRVPISLLLVGLSLSFNLLGEDEPGGVFGDVPHLPQDRLQRTVVGDPFPIEVGFLRAEGAGDGLAGPLPVGPPAGRFGGGMAVDEAAAVDQAQVRDAGGQFPLLPHGLGQFGVRA